MLLVDFSINDASFRSTTKATSMSMQPVIESMKVVVFDQNGIYLSQSDAELTEKTETGNVATGKYQAYFPISDKDEKRFVHFIANYTGKIEYGTELEVISKLTTSGTQDAFWQRVELDNLMATGSGSEMVLNSDAQTKLSNITLIRNFCSFTLTSTPETSNLLITGAEIYNVPAKGTIAPYSSDRSGYVGSSKSGFIESYQNYTTPEALIAAGYVASVPIDRTLKTYSTDAVKAATKGTVTLFSYEREEPVDEPAYILIKGKWGKSESARSIATETWYKINLRDVNDKYYPLLRNFNYKININNVKQAGAATAEEAAHSAGSGDISTDLRFSSLTNISNGEAKMSVTQTEVMLVSSNPVTVNYQFVANQVLGTVDNVGEIDGNSVVITLGKPGLSGKVFEGEPGIVDLSSSTSITRAASDDHEWRTLTFTPNAPAEFPRTQSVTITGNYSYKINKGTPEEETLSGSVSRTIEFTLRAKPVLSAEVRGNDGSDIDETVTSEKGTAFKLRVGIPDGLPSSIFPLILHIESSQNTLSSNEILPVESRKSSFNESRPTVAYLKTVNWTDYDQATIKENGVNYIDIKFKTSDDISNTFIHVSNEYFDPAITELKNPGKSSPTVNDITLTWVGSDRTDNSQFLIVNGQTILTAKVPKASTGVTFAINGALPVSGEKFQEVGNYAYYSYVVRSTVAGSDTRNMRVVVNDGSNSATVDIPVWKKRVTVGNTAFTSFNGGSGAKDNNRNSDWVSESNKKVWYGVVLKNRSTNRYLLDVGGDFDVSTANNLIENDERYCFQINESFVRSVNGMYLDIYSSLLNSQFGISYVNPNTLSNNYNNGFVFRNKSNTNRTFSVNNNALDVESSVLTLGVQNRMRWYAYPCKFEYVQP